MARKAEDIKGICVMKRLPLLLLIVLLAGCAGLGNSTQPAENVRLVMPFRPDVQFAPFYMAQENGYFTEQGLTVTFEHMAENEAVSLVGAGEVPFAIVSGEQVLLARAQGLPVVYVMAWWHDYPVAVAAPEDSGIETVQDLAGKRIGIPGLYGASYIGYRALLRAEGMAEDAATLDSIGYSQVEAMLAGQEDAVVIYANNEPAQLAAQGMPMNVIRVADSVHLASNGLIISETMLEENPMLVQRMTTAIWQGIEASLQDPDQAFEVSKKYVEGLAEADQEVMKQVLLESMEFWRTDQPGYTLPEAWRNMYDILLVMELIEGPLDVEAAYSNLFLPEP